MRRGVWTSISDNISLIMKEREVAFLNAFNSRKKHGTAGPRLGKFSKLSTGDNGKGKYQFCIYLLQQKNSFQSRNTQKLIEVTQKIRRNYFKCIKVQKKKSSENRNYTCKCLQRPDKKYKCAKQV